MGDMHDRRLDRLFRRYRSQGDIRALARIFDTTAPILLSLALRLSGHEADAEDAVQATFLTAVRKPESFDETRRLMPWLFGILALHVRQTRRRAGKQIDPERLALREPADPADQAAEREFRAELERATGRLSATYRSVVVPYLADGKTPSELARELGLSAGAVRVRLHRGLKLLRDALPGGLALGAVVQATAGRGLSAVRARVLAEAALKVGAPLGTALVTGVGVGALTLSKLAWLTPVAALLAGGFWWLGWGGELKPPAAVSPTPQEAIGERLVSSAAVPSISSESEPTASRVPVNEPKVHFVGEVRSNENDRPLQGARIWMIENPGPPYRRQLAAEAGSDGQFAFDAPAEAGERLWIEAPGRVSYRTPLSEVPRRESAEARGRSASDDGHEVDLGLFRLQLGAIVSGRVVLRETGAPVEGAELMLFTDVSPLQHPSPHSEYVLGRSEADGRFELDGRVPPDILDYGQLLFALCDQGLGWAKFHVPDDLSPVEELMIQLGPAAALDVRVVTADGQPLEGVLVQCIPGFVPWARGKPMTRPRVSPLPAPYAALFLSTTDGEGRARFPTLPVQLREGEQVGRGTAEYTVMAIAEGMCIREVICRLAPDADEQLELPATPVVAVTIRGTVVDDGGAPIADARVAVKTDHGSYRWLGSVLSAEDGSFVLELSDACVQRIEVIAEAQSHTSQSMKVGLPAEPGAETLRLVLSRAVPIAGRTLDDAGRPLANVQLYLYQGASSVSTRSGDDGRFTFEDAKPGSGVIQAQPPPNGEGLEYRPIDMWKKFPVVEVSGGEQDVDVVFERIPEPKARLVLECLDAQTGQRLTAREVEVRRDLEPDERMYVALPLRREKGRVLAEGLRAGWWTASVAAAGYATAYRRFQVAEEDLEVHVVLEATASASVEGVVDGGGHEWPDGGLLTLVHTETGAKVQAGSLFVARLRLDEMGRFSEVNLTPGRWRVWRAGLAYRDGHLPCSAEFEIELEPGENRGLVLKPTPLARLRLVTRSASTSKWVDVSIDDGSGEWKQAGTAVSHFGPSPRDFVVWLPPGDVRWRVSIRDHGRGPFVAEFSEGRATLRSGAVTRVEYRVIPLRD